MMRLLFTLLFLSSLNHSFSQYSIYISDAGGFNNPPWQILKFDENGENGEVFISENLGWPQDILFLEDKDQVLISNLKTNVINIHDANTGEYIDKFATMNGPTRMKIGPNGLIYVLQWNGLGQVHLYNTEGEYQGLFSNSGINSSIGMDWDSENNLYVSSHGGGFVRKFDPEGNSQGSFITGLVGPTNIEFDEDGNLIVLEYNGNKISQYSPEGEFIKILYDNIGQAEGIALLPNGKYLIGNGINNSVDLFSSEFVFEKELIEANTLSLLQPNAVVLRDVLNTKIKNVPVIKNLVTPSIGDYFKINMEAIGGSFRQFIIFDSTGVKIGSSVDPFLDARDYNNGLYIIQVELMDNTIMTTKIQVHK